MGKHIRKIQNWLQEYRDGRQNEITKAHINYVVSPQGWSIRHDGECLMANLPTFQGRITTSIRGINQGLVHFGGMADALKDGHFRWPNANVPFGVTWFHIFDGDKRLKLVPEIDKSIKFWHSSCQASIRTLIQAGATPEKCHVIPLGVDTKIFRPGTAQEKERLRAKMGIPQDATVVGSFQKDGLGWGAGNKPKLEKGPDIFCDAIERLAKKTKVFVLLSGPARGYVINRLKAAGIRYYHTGYLDHANDVAEYYRALDLYLITSRLEGGPKSALEAPASGIPLISTQVGMIPDIAKETSAIIPVESFDASEIAEAALSLLADDSRMRNAKKEGPRWVESYDWTSISKRYESELYKVFYDSTKREI